jgi:hypothetical protein
MKVKQWKVERRDDWGRFLLRLDGRFVAEICFATSCLKKADDYGREIENSLNGIDVLDREQTRP